MTNEIDWEWLEKEDPQDRGDLVREKILQRYFNEREKIYRSGGLQLYKSRIYEQKKKYERNCRSHITCLGLGY